MAVKNQKTVESSLALAFLKLADNREIETHEIVGLGNVGLKRLSIGARDRWVDETEDQQIKLLQSTVCDPETGELILEDIAIERLKELPIDVAEELGKLIFKQNGFKRIGETGSGDSKELKNSETSQS